MANQLLNLQELLHNQSVIISFSGRFSQTIIEELGEAVKKYLETEENTKTNVFNVFSIFIEQTQNIRNYCMKKENDLFHEKISRSCIVTIGKVDDVNYIHSGNLIKKEDTDSLVEQIEHLQQADKEQLKLIFKAKRKEAFNFSENQGAGLGLIDIARKSSQPIEYSLTAINEHLSFFTLKALV